MYRGLPLRERFDLNIDKSGGPDACWPWIGSLNGQGYGQIKDQGVVYLAHRLALTYDGRPPWHGLALHRCDNPPCVNPAHLYPGTQQDNMTDMSVRGRALTKDRCYEGHERTPENLWGSNCKACSNARRRERRAEKRRVVCQDCGADMLDTSLWKHRKQFHA